VPAKSKKQHRLMGIALAIKRGKLPASYSKEAAKIAKSMTIQQLRDYAKTKEKGLPAKKSNTKRRKSNTKRRKRKVVKRVRKKGRKRK